MLARLRAIVFLAVMTAAVIPWSFVVLAAWIAPQTTRYKLAAMWTRLAVRMARTICGLGWRIEGWQHLPDGPAIILPKHQSTWETFWLLSYMPRRLSFVYKRELHLIPFFGWAMASLGMINIDRSRGQDAFEQVVTQGEAHLRDDWWIVIFPEGTRTTPGSTRRYKTGGARLAVRTGVPVVPIAVNSGELWPRGPLIQRPGEITVSIGPLIETTGKTVDVVAAEVERWIETEMRRLAPHRYGAAYENATTDRNKAAASA
jgi:1-acyl-sn-glycerol-3-phosphate acyltransferase